MRLKDCTGTDLSRVVVREAVLDPCTGNTYSPDTALTLELQVGFS